MSTHVCPDCGCACACDLIDGECDCVCEVDWDDGEDWCQFCGGDGCSECTHDETEE